jgi:hypothetical protein
MLTAFIAEINSQLWRGGRVKGASGKKKRSSHPIILPERRKAGLDRTEGDKT